MSIETAGWDDGPLSPDARHAHKDARLAALAGCLENEKQALWRAGDLIVQLVADHLYSISDLSRKLDHPRIRLNEAYKTAQAFPPGTRMLSRPFFRHEQARKVAQKFEGFGLTPQMALAEIVALNMVANRQITRHFAKKYQPPTPPAPSSTATLLNGCHHRDFRESAPRIETGSVHLLFCDPPFLRRPGVKTGKVVGTGMARTECDNSDEDSARKLILDILKDGQRIMAPGGVLLLFQPSGMLDFRIHDGIVTYNWHVEAELIWDKGRTRPGNALRPYSTQLEKILVLVPQGSRARCYGKPLHTDLLQFKPISLVGCAPRSVHVLQKPLDLCQFLVRQHCPGNGLVVDAFGCSGTIALAAISEDRQFIYCESNRSNFGWGNRRILSALARNKSNAA